MKQLKIIIALLFLTGIFVQTAYAQFRKDNIALEKRDISTFTELDVAGAFTVHLMETESPFLEIEAQKHVMDDIETKVRNGRLYITLKHGIKRVKAITIHLGFQDLSEIDISGAVSLKSDAAIRTDRMDIDISGAARLELELIATNAEVDVAGAGSVFLCGQVEYADFQLEGAGKLIATDMVAKAMKLDVSGAGKAKVHVIHELDVNVAGVAVVKYLGNPEVRRNISGMASIRQVETY